MSERETTIQTNNMLINETNDSIKEIDLLDLAHFWLQHIIIIVIAAIVGLVAGILYMRFMVKPTYSAKSSMYVVSASSNSVLDLTDLNLGTSLAKDYVQLVQSRTMLERVIERSDYAMKVEQLRRMLSVSNESGTRIIVFRVTSPDPKQAQNLAAACADEAVLYLPEIMSMSGNPPTIIDRAILPTSPGNVNYGKSAVIGFVVALVLALGLFTVLYLAKDSFDSAEDIEKLIGVPPMAEIPESGQKHKGGYGYYTSSDKSSTDAKSA